MAGPSVKLAYAESTRLREAYLGLYDLVGHAIKPVGYTWNTAPSTQYPDTNKAELTDSVTGDPLDYQNAAWVGVQGAAEVVFDLGGPKPLRWVAVDLLRSKASGIAYPQSLTVDCDASGSAGFTTLGTWPLQLTSDADGEYVFSNPTALSATCAKIRVHLAGTQWTFLSEIELTGL